MKYRDITGRILFVSSGISQETNWMTCFKKPTGSLSRVKSKFLPLRDTREEAQADLDSYAQQRCMEEV